MDDHDVPVEASETHVSEVPDGGVKPPRAMAAMAASVGGRPIAWHFTEGIVTIVMEDGRKLRFRRKPRQMVEMAPATHVAGVGDGGVKPPRPNGRKLRFRKKPSMTAENEASEKEKKKRSK